MTRPFECGLVLRPGDCCIPNVTGGRGTKLRNSFTHGRHGLPSADSLAGFVAAGN